MKKLWILGAVATLSVALSVGWWLSENRTDLPEPPPQRLYHDHCAICHGETGRGDGPAAHLLQPRPRDFRLGSFRFVSTDNQKPTREDLFRTITRGLPGTAMPPWKHLSEEARWGLVDLLLDFNRQDWIESALEQGDSLEEAQKYAEESMRPGKPLVVPAEPEVTSEGLQRGHQLFLDNCASCHGADGRGKQDPEWKTAEGFPLRSRDLRRGVFKAGREGRQLFLRVAGGIPGTPMPSFGSAGAHWDIVHYVLSLSDPAAQARAEVAARPILAHKVQQLPNSVDDDRWQKIDPLQISLMPLSWSEGAVETLSVQIAFDRQRFAIRLRWPDATHDSDADSVGASADRILVFFNPRPGFPLSRLHSNWIASWSASGHSTSFEVDSDFLELLGGKDWRSALTAGDGVSSRWHEEHWSVELDEPLGRNGPGFEAGQGATVTFAIWNGSPAEAGEVKTLSLPNPILIDR